MAMEAILNQSAISLTRAQATAIAHHRHPIAVKMLALAAVGLVLFGLDDDTELTLGWSLVAVWGVGLALTYMLRLRAASVDALLQGDEHATIRYAVTDTKLIVDHGPTSLSRDWDSITSTRIDRGVLTLVAKGGVISIPLAHAPPELIQAVSTQLRRRSIPDPAPQPSFRRTYVVLLAILAVLALIVFIGDGPPEICDENPGLTYWDSDGWHTC